MGSGLVHVAALLQNARHGEGHERANATAVRAGSQLGDPACFVQLSFAAHEFWRSGQTHDGVSSYPEPGTAVTPAPEPASFLIVTGLELREPDVSLMWDHSILRPEEGIQHLPEIKPRQRLTGRPSAESLRASRTGRARCRLVTSRS
jgi:hypothetical protein